MNNFNKYFEAVKFLEGLVNIPSMRDYMNDRIDPEVYIKRTEYFLNLLGNPQNDFKIIHITGTSGKGTVSTMMTNVLEASGSKVGLFTSPFVVSSIEKIIVNDKYIAPQDFASIVEEIKPFLDEAYINGPYGRPTYFEIFLAIALLYFKKEKCEWVVLEVGCGGRYDATNIVKNPIITAITNIDYDHTHLLGKTLHEIASDKAGIIKKNSIFWTSENRPAILKIFKETCKKMGANFNLVNSGDNYMDRNKGLVKSISTSIGIKEKYIDLGIAKTKLPARFEIMQKDPLVIIDGAHNRSKIRSVVTNLEKLKIRKINLVIAISDNKDQKAILKEIIPLVDNVFATRFLLPDRPCTPPAELAKLSRSYLKSGAKINIFLDPKMAYEAALKASHKDDLVLVTGSFFLAGDLRKNWYSEEAILKKRQSF